MHLTDPHLFAEKKGELRGTNTYDSLSLVLDHILKQRWPADLVLVTGDIVQDDSRAGYEHFCDLLETLDLPVYAVPGNHDVPELMRAALARPNFHYCENLAVGSWHIININSFREGDAGGLISDDEMQRLASALEHTVEDNVLVCLHHPPLPVNSRWLDSVGLYNAEPFLQLLDTCPSVRGALFGHVHQAFDALHRGRRIIGTPSTCRQFKPGSDDFAVDDLPPAYRRVTLQGDGRMESDLVWVR